jgi:predicted N-acyltransferase
MGDIELPNLTIRIAADLSGIEAGAWNALGGSEHPFVSHAFLWALEESGSATPETGWAAQHVLVEDENGELLGAAPLYLKSHSQGEYIFDHGWADAFERAGGRYYPKALMAVPFTPVTGPRLLVRADAPEGLSRTVLAGCMEVTRQLDISSLHINFLPENDWNDCGASGLLQRTGEQFHWFNRGYETFDDFLSELSSRKRKTIRRERRDALASGDLEFETVRGGEITEEHWDAFFGFYMDTGSRKWGRPYLSREFFSLLSESLGDSVVLFLVRREGRYVAGALNLAGSDALYGRYWGCVEDHPFLHFEVCYYRAIDYAIEHKLDRVEAGAQGPHKLARGYLPVYTYSAHWIRNDSFRDAVAGYLDNEREHVDDEIEYLEERSPFRKED